MRHRGLDGDDHVGLQRPGRVIALISPLVVGQAWCLMTDEAHAMRQKIQIYPVGRGVHRLMGRRENLRAPVISPGIEGKDVAGFEALVGGRPIEALASRHQAVFEGQAPLDLLAPQSVDELMFRLVRRTPVEHGEHRGHDTLGSLPQQREFGFRLSRT